MHIETLIPFTYIIIYYHSMDYKNNTHIFTHTYNLNPLQAKHYITSPQIPWLLWI